MTTTPDDGDGRDGYAFPTAGTFDPEKTTAEIDGDFVVFLIGMRINRFWKIHEWLPVFLSMGRMLRELSSDPDSGLLGYETYLGVRNQLVVQYWRSFEHLREYAWERDAKHLPAVARFYEQLVSDTSVGIWHETYLVAAGQYENVYRNMPRYGLGRAGAVVPASGHRASAAGRLGLTDGDDAPIDDEGHVIVDELADPIGDPN